MISGGLCGIGSYFVPKKVVAKEKIDVRPGDIIKYEIYEKWYMASKEEIRKKEIRGYSELTFGQGKIINMCFYTTMNDGWIDFYSEKYPNWNKQLALKIDNECLSSNFIPECAVIEIVKKYREVDNA